MCTYDTDMSVYMPHMSPLYSAMWPGTLVPVGITLLAYAHYCTYKSNKNNKLQLLIIMLLPYLCQQQICPLNTKCMLHMPISSCADIRQLCQYICLIQTWCNQQCYYKDLYTITSLAYALNKYACHIIHIGFDCTAAAVYMQTPHYLTYM